MTTPLWRLDDPITRDGYERLLDRLGGAPLALHRVEARQARQRLEASLAPDQRALFLDAVDASTDASCTREEAAGQAALVLGVGLGAALARYPDAPAHTVAETASGVIRAVLGSELNEPDADGVARVALDAIRRLPDLGAGAQGAS